MKKKERYKGHGFINAIKRKPYLTIGILILIVHFMSSLTFIFSLVNLNILPENIMVVVVTAVMILFAILMIWGILANNKGIIPKIMSVLLSICLIVPSFFFVKAGMTVDNITKSKETKEEIIVAVKIDDIAKNLKDASNYNFAVQYLMKGEEIKNAVSEIERELGSGIQTTEYDNLVDQAKALLNGEVGAMVYNNGFSATLNEEVEGFRDGIKIIYHHEIISSTEEFNTSKKPSKQDTIEPFILYLSGIDVYGDVSTSSRSDVNILAVINPTTHKVLLVNTPRDYYVEFPNITGGQKDKLTHAGNFGPQASMDTLAKIYSTEIDYYAKVNFTSLIDIVDAVGGIEVYSKYDFTASSADKNHFNEGMNFLDGKKALEFSRERYNLPGGDLQRGRNQQAVITALIQKMTSPTIILSANQILDSVKDSFITNMETNLIQDLIKAQISDNIEWEITSLDADGYGDMQYCYSYGTSQRLSVVIPNYDSVEKISKEIENFMNEK